MSCREKMDIHEEFTEWSNARGVRLNGIAAHRFRGRGLGIIAERKLNVCRQTFIRRPILCYAVHCSCLDALTQLYYSFLRAHADYQQAGDEILSATTSALRTVLTVPKRISKSLRAISVNGLLAAEFAMDTAELRGPWRAVLPTKVDFEESMPIMWHSSLQELLPPGSLSILENQKKKISSDWAAVSAAFPGLSYDLYVYNWLLVSTRTFYFTSPKIKMKPLSRDDCLALIPLADLFNHADVGCEVTFSPSGYKICADREIEKGEEVYISYGNHSNDFLLVEYGFILAENRWDQISLDEIILPLLSEEQKERLKEEGFLGKYVLDRENTCYRTLVALKLLCMPVNKWQHLLTNGLEGEEKYQKTADRILLEVLKPYLKNVEEKIKLVGVLDSGLESQRDTLARRWKQVHQLLAAAISRIEN
jgi:hypothetical protein